MSCLQVNTSLKSYSLKPSVLLANEPFVVSVKSHKLSMAASLVSEPITVDILDMAIHPKVRTGIVCSIKEIHNYLNVSPSDVQWITPEYGIIYNVYSDMDWVIVTS